MQPNTLRSERAEQLYAPPHETESICPECNRIIAALVFERDEKIWISKTCPDHGPCEELYFGSAKMFKKFARYLHDGKGIENPNVSLARENVVCPMDCGLCASHLSHSALTNLVATNRCDLACWYCFFYAKKGGDASSSYVYEPTLDQIRAMVATVRAERPVPSNAIQITGGEPTLRKDIVEIVKICKEGGINHVQLNTNGINLALYPTLIKRLCDAGVNTVYMSFDGVTPRNNGKNYWEAPYAIENCRKAGAGVVLVPAVMKSANDQELGSIVRFAQSNIDIVRAINFQPISLVGRMTKVEREKYRITIPDAIHLIEAQTNGEIVEDDWFPVPSCTPFTHLVEAFTKKPQYELSQHFACGAGTYVFQDDNRKLIPITRFVDVEGFFNYLQDKADEIGDGSSRLVVGPKILANVSKYIDSAKAPKDLNLSKLLLNALLKQDYQALGDFHHGAMFLGMMHFQDKYNQDRERVMRCGIDYVTPDQRLIPFCAFNVIPEWYRDRIQHAYSIPIEQWEKQTGQLLEQGMYRGSLRKRKREIAKIPVV
jgi:uncharacterized radical SAM superfamily Fe-S cluster-containing enzyme